MRKLYSVFTITILLFSFIILIQQAKASAINPLYDSAINYWKFDESSGSTIIDYGSNNDNGTINGVGISRQTGIFGNCLYMNGTTGENEVDFSSGINFPFAYPHTICFWVKIPTSGTAGFLLGCINNGNYYIQLKVSGSNVLISDWSTGSFGDWNPSFSLGSINDWLFISLIFNGTTKLCYTNATLDGSTNPSSAPNSQTGLYLGRYGGYTHGEFYGYLDELRIYSRALTVSELKNLYLYNCLSPSVVSRFSYSPSNPLINQSIAFYGNFSTSSESAYSSMLSYKWSFGDSTTNTTSIVYHRFTTNGTFTVSLNVSSVSIFSVFSQKITVSKPYIYAILQYDPVNPQVNQTVTFWIKNINSSQTVTYDKWSFGDGSSLTGNIVTHTYTTNGTFTVKCRINSTSISQVFSFSIVIAPIPIIPSYPDFIIWLIIGLVVGAVALTGFGIYEKKKS